MSNNENPIIELPCNQITDAGQILDTSGNGLDGNVEGAQTVPNDTLGAVVYLDGVDDDISVAQNNVLNPEGDFTLEVWVAALDPQTTTEDIVIVEKWDGFATAYPYSLRYNSGGSVYASRYDGTRRPSITSQTVINDGLLHHLALVLQAGRWYLYVDGALDPAAPDGVADTTVASTANTAPLYLGSRGSGCYLSGALGTFRLYGWALDADQINLDITGDRTSTSAFTRTQPIDFGVYNENDLSLIDIDDSASGHSLTLQVENIDGQEIVLNPLTGFPTLSNYHFALNFRPGVLSQDAIATTGLASAGWQMTGPELLNGGSYSFYFIASANTTLSSASPLLMTLVNLSANPSGGSRETLVKLDYANLNYAGDSTPVSGSRSQRVALVNNFQPSSGTGGGTPFLVSFPQSNHLLNDGGCHSFDMRLTNISGQTLTFNPTDSDTPTSLVFAMDVGSSEGDMGTADDLHSFSVSPKAYTWAVEITNESESIQCTLQPTNTPFSLSPGGSLYFTLENLGSSLPSGEAYLYIDFSNVSGIADGQAIGIIVKTPLLYLSDADHSVGIGTATPDGNSKLRVSGTLTATNIVSQGNVQTPQALITQSLNAPEAAIDYNLSAGSFSGGRGIVQPGMVMMWAGDSGNVPDGWMLCDGRQLDQPNYPELYAVLTQYHLANINGVNVFNLPNLVDRFVVGAGNLYSPKSTGGAASVTLTTGQLPSHNHSSSVSSENQHRHSFLVDTGGGGNDGSGDMLTSNWGNNVSADHQEYTDYQSAHTHTVTIGNTGGSQGHENRPPYFGIYFIIYTGVSTN
ncbi:MAG: tail fiber protein [Methylovulum sp.]|nr:tail fiber protein [Methylovulum sp.]